MNAIATNQRMGFGQFLKIRMRGFPAWFARRIYYLFQTPGWRRRVRIMIDWTIGVLFRPDIVKVGLDSEIVSLLREVAQRDILPQLIDKPGPASELSPVAARTCGSQDLDMGHAW